MDDLENEEFYHILVGYSRNIVLHVIKDYSYLGNTSRKHMSSHISDFSILKQFCINTRIRKVLSPMQIFWCFLEVGWIKVNTNGVVRGVPSFVACGGIF